MNNSDYSTSVRFSIDQLESRCMPAKFMWNPTDVTTGNRHADESTNWDYIPDQGPSISSKYNTVATNIPDEDDTIHFGPEGTYRNEDCLIMYPLTVNAVEIENYTGTIKLYAKLTVAPSPANNPDSVFSMYDNRATVCAGDYSNRDPEHGFLTIAPGSTFLWKSGTLGGRAYAPSTRDGGGVCG